LRKNCLLQHVIEGNILGKIEVTGKKRGRRRKQLLDEVQKMRGYWKLKEEAVDRSVWRIRFRRDCGPVARQTVE
jgi:hypothetical protein